MCLIVHDMKLVIGGLNTQVGREDIFTGTIGKPRYHANINDNGIKLESRAAMKSTSARSELLHDDNGRVSHQRSTPETTTSLNQKDYHPES